MKMISLLNEYSMITDYVRGIKFKVLINITLNGCKIQYIPENSANIDKLNNIGKESVSRTINENLNKKLAMQFTKSSDNDAGISFISPLSQLENHILLMLK